MKRIIGFFNRYSSVLTPIILFLLVISFWSFTYYNAINEIPRYHKQLDPVRNLNWQQIWTWTDYGHYHRYAPIGLLLVGKIDKNFYAPFWGIDPMSDEFILASRLIPVYFLLFALISVLLYFLLQKFSMSRESSFLASIFIGINDGFSYFFYYVDTLAICLLLIFGILAIFFFEKIKKENNIYNYVFYYLFILLSIGSWDQWINLLIFILLYTIIIFISNRKINSKLLIHGIVIPLVLFSFYLVLRLNSISTEVGSVSEAQYVFSYPYISLMIEDVISNLSHHIASIFDVIFIPWPMLSQAVINKIDINQYNVYNTHFGDYADIHYLAFAEWYAGLFFGFFICFFIFFVGYLLRNKSKIESASIGLLLVISGLIVHLPVMFRAYFIMPGYVGLLNYKDSLSVLGASILIAWLFNEFLQNKVNNRAKYFVFFFTLWLFNNYYFKILINFQHQRGTFPW